MLRGLGAPLGRRGVVAQTGKLGLAVAQFNSEADHIAASLVALQRCGHRELFRFIVLRRGLLKTDFARAKLFFDTLQ